MNKTKIRHEQDKEMEQVRYRVNSYFDRAVRLHQMEFEIQPELWERLQTARNAIVVLGSRGQIVEDLNRLSPPMLEEFLKTSDLLEAQKEELRQASNKTEYYRNARDWQRLHSCKVHFQNYRTYLARMGVFLDPDLEQLFQQAENLVWEAISEKEFSMEMKSFPIQMAHHEALVRDGDVLLGKIKVVVQSGLRDSKR